MADLRKSSVRAWYKADWSLDLAVYLELKNENFRRSQAYDPGKLCGSVFPLETPHLADK